MSETMAICLASLAMALAMMASSWRSAALAPLQAATAAFKAEWLGSVTSIARGPSILAKVRSLESCLTLSEPKRKPRAADRCISRRPNNVARFRDHLAMTSRLDD